MIMYKIYTAKKKYGNIYKQLIILKMLDASIEKYRKYENYKIEELADE